MDVGYDWRFLWRSVRRPHLHINDYHRYPNSLLQGGHRYRSGTCEAEETAYDKVAELVFPRGHHVLFVR